MDTKFWIITVVLFIVWTLILVKFSRKKYKAEYSEKMWKVWGAQSYYWQGVVIVSSLITTLSLLLLKWGGVLI